MSVNIINVDGKCITRVMRDFADFLAQSCCKAESSSHHRQPSLESLEGEEGVSGDGMEGEDVCGLGRRTSFFHTEEGWGPDLTELQTMIETFKVSHDLEIEAIVTSHDQEIEALKAEFMGVCEELRKELEEMRDASTNLMEVVGDLSKDILLDNKEIESLKLYLTEEDEDVEDDVDDDDDDLMTEDETEV